MTDARRLRPLPERSGHGRWSAAALLAPTAAAVFAGVTAWTVSHPPAPVSTPQSAPAPVAPAPAQRSSVPDPALATLRTAVVRDGRIVTSLRRTLAALRSQPAVAGGSPVAGVAPAESGSTYIAPANAIQAYTAPTYSGPAYTAPVAAAPAPVAAAPAPVAAAPAPVVAAPPPAPAPPAHTTTGASGAPK